MEEYYILRRSKEITLRTSPEPVRSALRTATNDVHCRIHRSIRLQPLFDQTLGREDYRALLCCYFGFFDPLDGQLAALHRATPQFQEHAPFRPRTYLLRDDLSVLGLSDVEIDRLPKYRFPVDTPGRYAGALYLVEGSALGGRILFDRLKYLFDENESRGRRYFMGHGQRSALVWQDSCALIETIGETAPLVEIVDTACALFEAFERWLAADFYSERGG